MDELVNRMQWELLADITRFDRPGWIESLPDCVPLNPGLADLQLAEISQLGHRDKFPRPYDWENLLPLLETGEELLWIVNMASNQPNTSRFSLYLGLKTSATRITNRRTVQDRRHRFRMICDAFARRAFPESSLVELSADETVDFVSQVDRSSGSDVSIITGVPSPKRIEREELSSTRDEEARPFASLNDALEPVIDEASFTLVFVAARSDAQSIQASFDTKTMLRSEIAPLIEQEVTGSVSVTHEKHRDKSTAASTNKTHQQKRSLHRKLGSVLVQSFTGTGWYDEKGEWVLKTRRGRRPEPSIQSGTTTTASAGDSESNQKSESVGQSRLNAKLQLLDESLQRSIEHLQQTCGTGGYWGSVFVYCDDPKRMMRISSCIRAVLSGADTYLRPLQELPFEGPASKFHLHASLASHELLATLGVGLEILNADQAGQLLLLPEADLPGWQLKRSVFYGRPTMQGSSGVRIGQTAFGQPTLTAAVEQPLVGQSRRCVFQIPDQDLCSHLLVVGTTGSGKTERAVHILNAIDSDRYRMIILETAKKTYRNRLRRGKRDPLVYTLGNSHDRPFRINPFYFDQGASLKRHISVVADAMSELLPMEALIGPKLREAIELSYQECGWNIETGKYVGEGRSRYPDMIVFNAAVHDVCATLESYGAEVKANYRGALLNRAAIFLDEVYQDIFAFGGNKPVDQLFPHDTIIEMEDMPASEINMPAFIMSIVLERLRAYRSMPSVGSTSGRDKPKILLVIEEAHNVLHRRLEDETSERESGRGRRLLEQIVRLLQEGRQLGFGVVVVDQSAQYLASAVIANTNTKIAHRQEDWGEVETVGSALGIPEEDWKDLQLLGQGECIVRSSLSARPVKLRSIPELDPPRDESWKPFDKHHGPVDYDAARRAFEWITDSGRGPITPDEQRAFLDWLLKWANYDYDLLRYAVGRHFIRMQRYDEAKKVGWMRNRRELFERFHLELTESTRPAMRAGETEMQQDFKRA